MDQIIEQWDLFRESFPVLKVFLVNLMAALGVFILGIIIARWVRKRIRRAQFGTDHVDTTLRPVIASAVFYVIMAITVYAALRRLGVEPTGLLAVFGAAGLAIGLALKDTLGNIAAGFMLLMLRPLNVGEFIDTPGAAGTVQEVGLFSTAVKNVEGVFIFVPNGQIWSNRIQNFGRHTERKLIMNLGVGYDTDLEKAKALLIDTMRAQSVTLELPEPPLVFVMEFGDSAITLSARVWLPAADWLLNASNMRIAIKKTLDEAGIEIPFPQRVVTTRK